MIEPAPLVSVVMISYGHEKYIAEAIRGVFMQKTSFPVELLIANDCSPDNSDQIIRETIQSAPENITVRYTRHEKNLGMIPNFIWALEQAKGKYIALCEGDDYWIAENKLQMQVDFLKNNKDFAICCHNYKMLDGTSLKEKSFHDRLDIDEFDIVELSKKNLVPTLTAVFRKVDFQFKDWVKNSPVGDYPLFMQIAQYGKIKYFNKKMAVYRQNVGVWSSKNSLETNRKMIEMFDRLIEDFGKNLTVFKGLTQHQSTYIKEYLKHAPLNFRQLITHPLFNKISLKNRITIALKKLS